MFCSEAHKLLQIVWQRYTIININIINTQNSSRCFSSDCTFFGIDTFWGWISLSNILPSFTYYQFLINWKWKCHRFGKCEGHLSTKETDIWKKISVLWNLNQSFIYPRSLRHNLSASLAKLLETGATHSFIHRPPGFSLIDYRVSQKSDASVLFFKLALLSVCSSTYKTCFEHFFLSTLQCD